MLLSDFFIGKLLPNFDLENMISTYMETIFHGKNGPNSPKEIQGARFE
jgi:hypothetical protein